ncbi:MAG: hypothetical protein J0I43_14870 [Microbacterium sp.]|uniref:hypothetical protein n=1 Tax=Microbacterium sp. TaxID=51671 RepID=UPI001AC3F663|nr:hypothetical protein [Microbacterium sp.]MBN9178631.1 hypothetical protein [Microbacterium sp.]
MKAWIVRFVSLYVFNVVVLLLIGLLTPAHVGWAVIWASVILTLAELFVKPLLQGMFRRSAAKSAGERTRAGEALVQGLIVLAVAAIIWVITLLLTGVNARGSWFWAYVLPPVIIAIGCFVYSKIDDRVEAKTAGYYDRAEAGIRGTNRAGGGVASTAPATGAAARTELDDGLTPEQRKMLDDLGKS